MTKKQRKGSIGRGILIGPPGNGARLKNSISRSRGMTYKSVIIGIKGPAQAYASIHNFGLRGKAWGKHPFTMPRRQFMGESRTLNRKIIKLIDENVKKAL
jgi:phage gpG-like protein